LLFLLHKPIDTPCDEEYAGLKTLTLERRFIMKKFFGSFGLMLLVMLVSLSFTTGCAKKAAMKEGAVVSQVQKAAPQAAATAAPVETASDDAAARERALREQALREQAAREKAAREAAEKAKRDADAKAAAILNELQIADIHFDFDKYNLTSDSQETLKKAAPAYLKYSNFNLVVEGHCDERGTVEYNLALGEKRANEAAKFLGDLGVAKDRIKTISYGKEMPLDKGHNEEAWAKNRRAHFLVSPAK
jgi:peptidoglycan-associated lipoprotein